MARFIVSILCLVCCSSLGAVNAAGMTVSMDTQLRGNPIRKVVTMLQDMQKAVETEGEKEKVLFDKSMCYCSTTSGNLESSIQTSSAQIDSLTGSLSKSSAQKSQLAQDIIQHKADREEATKAVASSKALRGKEAAEFAASSGEAKAQIFAMDNALAALNKGVSASLLQTTAGQTIKHVLENSPAISDSQRGVLLSFLESGEGEGGTDQIVGIVEQMKETMEADVKETTAEEEEAKASFSSLSASKEKEIAAATAAIESKMARVAEAGVAVAQGKADLKDTEQALAEDQKFKGNLAETCATKEKEQDERVALRAQEIQAISETVEMLNGDEALELFKKTLPSPAAASSFLQVSSHARAHAAAGLQMRATALLRNMLSHSVSVKTMLLKLKSTGKSGKSITDVIDGMIASFKKEQEDSDKKKDFCTAELAKTEAEVGALKKTVADIDADVEEKQDTQSTLATQISTIQQGIADLDKSVVEATQQRKEEHAEYVATAAANQAAAELLGMAANRMKKFYAPDQYKAPPTTTEAAAYSFIQLKSEYKKNSGAGGIVGMLEEMVHDVNMDLAAGKMDEKTGQKDYEKAMEDAAAKRQTDSKLMVEKNGNKADGEVELQTALSLRSTKGEQLDLAEEKMHDLHINCDHHLQGYEDAKTNRAAELETLDAGKAVLEGKVAAF